MWIKNISGVSQRLMSVSGDISVAPNGVVEIKSSRFNPRLFVEVDAAGNLKSDAKVLITENDKRTVAVDMEPVVAPSGVIQEKIVDKAADPVPVAPAEDKPVEPVKKSMNTTKSVLGRPKKLQ